MAVVCIPRKSGIDVKSVNDVVKVEIVSKGTGGVNVIHNKLSISTNMGKLGEDIDHQIL